MDSLIGHKFDAAGLILLIESINEWSDIGMIIANESIFSLMD